MKIPIPFLHWWESWLWGGVVDFRCRRCRICDRFEVHAYGGWFRASETIRSESKPVGAESSKEAKA